MRGQRLAAALCLVAVLGPLGCTRSVAGEPSVGTAAAPSSASSPAPAGDQPRAVVPGWQPVLSAKRNAIFDAPPSWKVEQDNIVVGYESGSSIVAGSGSATFRHGLCPGHPDADRALAVLSSSSIADLSAAAADSATRWAALAYEDDSKRRPQLTPESPARLRTSSGLDGVAAKTVARPASVGPCGPATGVVRALAVTIRSTGPGRGTTVVLVVVSDTDVPDAAPEPDLQQILPSLRQRG